MISIVIPLFNKEAFIAETIDSVLNQTFQDFELLIVDDGSTDSSVAIVNGYNDGRIRVISIKNSGVSVARNTGINKATNQWIALLDGDDWWAPTFLAEMIQAIKTFPKQAIFASGRSRVFNTEIERYAHPFLPEDGTIGVCNYYETIRAHLPLINSSNVVIKKELFETKGYFRVGQKMHEDHDLWMRLCTTEDVVFVNKPLSFYRKTESDTASNHGYSAADFLIYLQTIDWVYSSVSPKEQKHIKLYANSFISLTYIKHYWSYKKEDKKMLWKYVSKFSYGMYGSLCRLTKVLPFNLYPLLKVIK